MIKNPNFKKEDRIKVKRVLNVLWGLGEKDRRFAEVWCDFDERNDGQIKRLIDVYDECEGNEPLLETSVRSCVNGGSFWEV